MEEVIRDFEESPYYDRTVRVLIEDHLAFIISQGSLLEVPAVMRHRYDGNLYGLLAELTSLPKDAYWLVLRVNQYSSPTEYRSNNASLIMPDYALVQSIINRHLTLRNNS